MMGRLTNQPVRLEFVNGLLKGLDTCWADHGGSRMMDGGSVMEQLVPSSCEHLYGDDLCTSIMSEKCTG